MEITRTAPKPPHISESGTGLTRIAGIRRHYQKPFRAALLVFCGYLLTFSVQGVSSADSIDLDEATETIEELIASGDRYYQQGKLEKAQSLFSRALDQARKKADTNNEGWALKHLGAIALNQDQINLAMEYAEQALTIGKELSDPLLKKNALNVIGLVHKTRGNNSDAIEVYKHAESIVSVASSVDWKISYNLGEAYKLSQQYESAIQNFINALAHVKATGNIRFQVVILDELGDSYYWIGRYLAAVERYTEALSLTSEQAVEQELHSELGFTLYAAGQLERAVKHFDTASKIAGQIGNTPAQINALTMLAESHFSLNRYQEAIHHANNSIKFAEQINVPSLAKGAWGTAANAYFAAGQFNQSEVAYERYVELIAQFGDTREQIAGMAGLGSVKLQLEDYTAAKQWLEAANELKNNDPTIDLNILPNLGVLFTNLGDYDSAIRYFRENLEDKKFNGDQLEILIATEHLGNANFTGGYYKIALENYLRALELAEHLGDVPKKASVMSNLVWAYHRVGDIDSAIHFANESVLTANLGGDPWVQGQAYQALHQLQVLTGDSGSLDTALKLMKHSEQTGEPPLSHSLSILAIAYEDAGQHDDSITVLNQTLELARQSNDRILERETLAYLGTAYRGAGDLPAAEKTLRSAISLMESVRHQQGQQEDFRSSLLEKQRQAYQQLQSILIDQGKTDEALEVSESGRATALAALFNRNVEVDGGKISQPEVPDLKEIIAVAKAQNLTIVEYALTLEAIYIWVVKPTGKIAFHKIDAFIPSAALTPAAVTNQNTKTELDVIQTINEARGAIAIDSSGETSAINSLAQLNEILSDLYQLLIEPIASHLPESADQRIIFIPQGELFQVPFPALRDADGKYLVEKHTVQTAASIQLIKLSNRLKQQRAESEAKGHMALVVGNPTMPTWSPSSEIKLDLAPLPGAEKEAIAIANILDVTALTGNTATEVKVRERLANASIAHFATHGLLDYGDPGESGVRDIPGAIALAPDPSIAEPHGDGLLTSREIMEMKLQADMAVLSACNTGSGTITADGVLGLTRALIAAGVPSIIVSLWAVPDAPTSELMTAFYTNLISGKNKAQSLRHAMLETMVDHPNPTEWAAFTLIGEAL